MCFEEHRSISGRYYSVKKIRDARQMPSPDATVRIMTEAYFRKDWKNLAS